MLPYRPVLLAFVTVTLALACRPALDAPGVPLYPNAATRRLPRSRVAQVNGPIASIDGRDLRDKGGPFDLLPGCHVVELDRRLTGASYSLDGTYLSGQFPRTIYAIRMKASARYLIRRTIDVNSTGQGTMILSAREEGPTGARTDLVPASSMADINACREEDAE